jgi:hypothetical protein
MTHLLPESQGCTAVTFDSRQRHLSEMSLKSDITRCVSTSSPACTGMMTALRFKACCRDLNHHLPLAAFHTMAAVMLSELTRDVDGSVMLLYFICF